MIIVTVTSATTALIVTRKRVEFSERLAWKTALEPKGAIALGSLEEDIVVTKGYPGGGCLLTWGAEKAFADVLTPKPKKARRPSKTPDAGVATNAGSDSLYSASSLSVHSKASSVISGSVSVDDHQDQREAIALSLMDQLATDLYCVLCSIYGPDGLHTGGEIPLKSWMLIKVYSSKAQLLSDSEPMATYISTNVCFDGCRFSFDKYIRLVNQQLKRLRLHKQRKKFYNAPLMGSGSHQSRFSLKLGATSGFMYWFGDETDEVVIDNFKGSYEKKGKQLTWGRSVSGRGSPKSADKKAPCERMITASSIPDYPCDSQSSSCETGSKHQSEHSLKPRSVSEVTTLAKQEDGASTVLALPKRPNTANFLSPKKTILRGPWTRLNELTGGGVKSLIDVDGNVPSLMPLFRALMPPTEAFSLLHALSCKVFLTNLGGSQTDVLFPVLWGLVSKGDGQNLNLSQCAIHLVVASSKYVMVPIHPDDFVWMSPYHTTIPPVSYKDGVSPLREFKNYSSLFTWRTVNVVQEDVIVDGEVVKVTVRLLIPRKVHSSKLSHVILEVESSILPRKVQLTFIDITPEDNEQCTFRDPPKTSRGTGVQSHVREGIEEMMADIIRDLLEAGSRTKRLVKPYELHKYDRWGEFAGVAEVLAGRDTLELLKTKTAKARNRGSNSNVHKGGDIHRVQIMAAELENDTTMEGGDTSEKGKEDNGNRKDITGIGAILRFRLFMWRENDEGELDLIQLELATSHYTGACEEKIKMPMYWGIMTRLASGKLSLQIDESFTPYLPRSFYTSKFKGAGFLCNYVLPLTLLDMTEEVDIYSRSISQGMAVKMVPS